MGFKALIKTVGFKAWIETGRLDLKLVGMNGNWKAWIRLVGFRHELKLDGAKTWFRTGRHELELVGMNGNKWTWIKTGELKLIGFKGFNQNWWSQVNENIHVLHVTYRCCPRFYQFIYANPKKKKSDKEEKCDKLWLESAAFLLIRVVFL